MSDFNEAQSQSLEKIGIQSVSNANQKKSQGPPQNFIFEPKAELVDLPSHGYLYHEATNDPDIIEKGAIKIRPMTVAEEKILNTSRLVKSGQALDLIFENVIKSTGFDGEPLDVGELLSSDRVYLMLWLRSVSYGNIYKFNLVCPSCSSKFEHSVDLGAHPIEELTDSEIKEPFEFTLPFSGYTLFYRLPRGKDESELVKLGNQPKKINDLDESSVKRLVFLIQKIVDPEGKDLPKNLIEPFMNQMLGGDASAFRNELEEVDVKISDIKNIECPSCSNTFDTPIPLTESFFRATR